ncbi:RNA polymeras-like protein II mediator complex subunit 10 [Polychaeton citri CBS 116435]|uniref:Mediator of RNA polymerase II transcription subunit 10 n=1 Tax=Polychaeton citri CBS 116435 TaxID=1314669 RepID=A0A9P4QB89_9PEZI|nr:RNA polymeras-like protein II mediator complex subunit 10 [Polychaeton citri CBS 116435]
MAAATLEDVDQQLRDIITNLYFLIQQAHAYSGPGTQQSMTNEVKTLIDNLVKLTNTSRNLTTNVPYFVVHEYIEKARNPDIYNRDLVEFVMKFNQSLKGKSEAFGQFRDILGREMMSAIPDIKDDVRKVLEASGGKVEG